MSSERFNIEQSKLESLIFDSSNPLEAGTNDSYVKLIVSVSLIWGSVIEEAHLLEKAKLR